MFLAAYSLGLGSCWIGYGMPLDKSNKGRELLGVPKDYSISALLIFGYPKSKILNIPKRSVKLLKWI